MNCERTVLFSVKPDLNRNKGEIQGIIEYSKQLERQMFENLQNCKDLKPLERDSRTRCILFIQILLISNVQKNSFLKDVKLKHYM